MDHRHQMISIFFWVMCLHTYLDKVLFHSYCMHLYKTCNTFFIEHNILDNSKKVKTSTSKGKF